MSSVYVPNVGDVKFPDDMSREDILSAIQNDILPKYGPKEIAPPEAPLTRTWGEAAKDIGGSFTKGIGSLVQLPSQAAGLITGDTTPGIVGETGKAIQDFGQSMKSKKLLADEAAQQASVDKAYESSGIMGEAGQAITGTLSNPALLSSFVAEQIPNFIGSLGSGFLAKIGVKSAMSLAKASAEAAATSAAKAGVGTAIASGMAMQGADIGAGTFDAVYENLGKTQPDMPEEERHAIALEKARIAAVEALAVSGATNLIPGAQTLEKVLLAKGIKKTEKEAAKGVLRRGAEGFAGEALQEGIEEGPGGQLLTNIGVQQVDPTQSLGKGVGAATAMGSLVGGLFGGIGGAMHTSTASPATTEDKPLTLETLAETPLDTPIIVYGPSGVPREVYYGGQENGQHLIKLEPDAAPMPLGKTYDIANPAREGYITSDGVKVDELSTEEKLDLTEKLHQDVLNLMGDSTKVEELHQKSRDLAAFVAATPPSKGVEGKESKAKPRTFESALQDFQKLPAGVNDDPALQTNIGDLVFAAQHEIDLQNDGEADYKADELAKFKRFVTKYQGVKAAPVETPVDLPQPDVKETLTKVALPEDVAKVEAPATLATTLLNAGIKLSEAQKTALGDKPITDPEAQTFLAALHQRSKGAKKATLSGIMAEASKTAPEAILPSDTTQPEIAPSSPAVEATTAPEGITPTVPETAPETPVTPPESQPIAEGMAEAQKIIDQVAPVETPVEPQVTPQVAPVTPQVAGPQAVKPTETLQQVTNEFFSEEFKQREPIIRKKAKAALESMGLGKYTTLALDPLLSADRTVNAVYHRTLIKLAVSGNNSDQIMSALNHEAIHALKALGIITPQEWKTLTSMAERHWMKLFNIEARYPLAKNMTREDQIEEAVAEAFATYSSGRSPVMEVGSTKYITKDQIGLIGQPRGIWGRIKAFFGVVNKELLDEGFTDATKVFERIQTKPMTPTKEAVAAAQTGAEKNSKGEVDGKRAESVGTSPAKSVSKEGAVSAKGVHFSTQERTVLSSAYFGQGYKGAELGRVKSSDDERLKHRIYFYVNTGKGIRPESGVGGVAHQAALDNLYDIESDRLNLLTGDPSTDEGLILDAGFNGYLSQDAGVAVLLGKQDVQVKRADAKETVEQVQKLPLGSRKELIQAFGQNKSLPGGEMRGKDWKKILPSVAPELASKIDLDKIDDDLSYYKNDLWRVQSKDTMPAKFSRAFAANHKREKTTGRYVGAPDWVGSSSRQLKVLHDRLFKLAEEGKVGKLWYERSSKAILDMVGGDKKQAEKFVGLVAIFSQGNKVSNNMGAAIKAWYEWKNTGHITAGRFPATQGPKAENWLNHGTDYGGIKVNNFYTDLMEEIDPASVDEEHSTMDMWMALAGDYGAKILDQGPKYLFMQREIKSIADELKWKPHQVQAAIWTAIKARVEGSEAARKAYELRAGIAEMKMERDEETDRESLTHSIIKGKEYDHFRAATRFGLNSPITQAEIDATFYDFQHSISQRLAQMSTEATPGVTSGVLPGIHKAEMKKKVEYQNAINFVMPEIYKKLGMLASSGGVRFSGWQGITTVGKQDKIAIRLKNGKVDEESRLLLNLASDIYGMATSQEGVAWHFPTYEESNAPRFGLNGMDIDLNRVLTESQTDTLYQLLADKLGHAFSPPIPTDTGFRVLNFPDELFAYQAAKEAYEADTQNVENKAIMNKAKRDLSKANDSFNDAVIRALDKFEFLAKSIKRFSSDGELRENNWSNGNAEYKGRIVGALQELSDRDSKLGRSDIWGWLSNELIPQVEAVNKQFSRKYGWGNSTVKRSQALAPSVEKYSKAVAATPEFKRWFGNSQIKDESGPTIWYHGTARDITEFKQKQAGAIFLTREPRFAESFAHASESWMTDHAEEFFDDDTREKMWKQALKISNKNKTDTRDEFNYLVINSLPTKANIMPLFVKAENPFDYDNPAHIKALLKLVKDNNIPLDGGDIEGLKSGYWTTIESPEVQIMLDELGHDAFYVEEAGVKNLAVYEPTQIKSATGNKGEFDPSNPDIRYSRAIAPEKHAQAISVITGLPVTAVWSSPDLTAMENFIFNIQDKHIDLKRVQEEITKNLGPLSDAKNVRLKEELYHNRVAKQNSDFLRTEVRPLLEAMQRLKVDGDELQTFLNMRHAEERNIEIAKINPSYPDGGSGTDTADARRYLAALSPSKRANLNAVAAHIDKITKGTRKLMVDSGLEKQETIDAWEGVYKHYVPLQRKDVAVSSGTGQGFDVRGKEIKRALGSTAAVKEILANVVIQRERTIIRSEKNRVDQAVLGLALAAPNPDFWTVVDPSITKHVSKNRTALAALGISTSDINNIIQAPTSRQIDPATGLVIDAPSHMLGKMENVLHAKVNGEEKYVIFNQEDPRADRMLRTLKNLDSQQLGMILGTTAKVTRYFSAVNTQYNPVFGIVNLLRDFGTSLFNLSTTDIKGKQARVSKNVPAAMLGVWEQLRAERDGKKATGHWAKLYERFEKAGGPTGYRDQYATTQDRVDAIKDEFKRLSEGKAKQAGRGLLNVLSDYNSALENAVRLSAFDVALKSGKSEEQAASIAKNLTVNFNRKGDMAVQAGAMYAFFNASVQGTARLAETLAGPAGKKITLGGIAFGSLQAITMAIAGFDDDQPPEFIKAKNIVLPMMNGKYLTWPMPLGFNILPTIGRLTTEWALSGFKDSPKKVSALFTAMLDTVNPVGSGTLLQTMLPTVIDPLGALAENKDAFGRRIAKQDISGLKPTPGYTRTKDTATPWAKWTSYYLNLATGGTKYTPGIFSPTPDQIDYLIGQATGGVGRELSKGVQTGTSLASGEELPTYKIPLASRFYGDTQETASQSTKFYENITRINLLDEEIKGRRTHKEGATIAQFRKEHPESALTGLAKSTEYRIQHLNTLKRKALEQNATAERIKQIDTLKQVQMKRFNEIVKKRAAA